MEQSKKGFIPVMLTPFKDNGAIDYSALTRLTEMYLRAGAAGVFANCLSSEMFELSGEERLAIIKHVVETVDGAVPVVATGTFGGPVEKQADFIKRVYDTGTSAVIAITSLLADANEPDIALNDRVFDLFDQTENIPLGFYECPVPYKRLLSAEQLHHFAATGRVIYHKDTCLKIDVVKQKLEASKINSAFGLYDAYMVHAVESLKAGSAGLSCIQGNFFPELIVWLCNHYADASRQHEVAMVQEFLTENMDVMHNVYPVIAKYYLTKRGLKISTTTRRDVGYFSPAIRNKIEDLYSSYTMLQSEIGID
ncbi:dihydrodipicolinate synthase family protein [Mucilaginibacter rubeus]|uniref:Dihydrodipicolinate synthase family protein n=1 Tax=Mucilaginibacter rubeus TaxID=2027860 RepID=A0AAE6MJF4_9SPHI|nr:MULTISPECIES: dihydrodipicolinate synthase family protein [Mucilaginibacter]QEM05284.1 dihydrodipicolinate synthase family protein [Mucilaginibacter rubeus]QEM17875.1 dihydrodipicolinate synthase family protein [Mucilaginibacter gossypii]QTE45592.1 dihydrodipicolinate synthase family protein [Mucilaginibacter rubeus]QTE52189.1 dihydrodipicolinate synthase family protein [Mucilaginibacter rubeus]QTE57277.1 dihydrodipicolinate synthase family protein [Mucilaginibacter rubeus]